VNRVCYEFAFSFFHDRVSDDNRDSYNDAKFVMTVFAKIKKEEEVPCQK